MKIVYMVNGKCNTNCFHCYRDKRSREKSVEECENDIKHLKEQGHEVVVAGAEVLCDLEKIKLYKLVGQKHLLSNGILLADNPAILKQLAFYGIEEVKMSWHIGFPELAKSVPEDIILHAIRNIRRDDLMLEIGCVISNTNFNKLDEIVGLLIKNGIKEVKFIQLMPTNKKTFPYLLSECQKGIFFDQIKRMRQTYAKEALCIRLHANFNMALTDRSVEAKRLGLFCPAGKELIVVEYDGKIYPCPFLANEKYLIGRMENGRLAINRNIENDGKNCLAEISFEKK
jgi:MoaA/NifB/PqqE/SkfB family radical SAM enzyme